MKKSSFCKKILNEKNKRTTKLLYNMLLNLSIINFKIITPMKNNNFISVPYMNDVLFNCFVFSIFLLYENIYFNLEIVLYMLINVFHFFLFSFMLENKK